MVSAYVHVTYMLILKQQIHNPVTGNCSPCKIQFLEQELLNGYDTVSTTGVLIWRKCVARFYS